MDKWIIGGVLYENRRGVPTAWPTVDITWDNSPERWKGMVGNMGKYGNKSKFTYIYIYVYIYIYLYIYIYVYVGTRSTAQGGGGSFRIGYL